MLNNAALRIAVLDALVNIQNNGPKQKDLGICANVDNIVSADDDLLSDRVGTLLNALFYTWPEKSTCTAYPVGKWAKSPTKLFWYHFDNNMDMWSNRSTYGLARRDLLAHTINALRALIDEE